MNKVRQLTFGLDPKKKKKLGRGVQPRDLATSLDHPPRHVPFKSRPGLALWSAAQVCGVTPGSGVCVCGSFPVSF